MSNIIDSNIIIPIGKQHIEKTNFEGSPYFNVIVMYFLSHKHDNSCVIIGEPYTPDHKKSIHWFDLGHKNKIHNKHSPRYGHKHDDTCVLLPSSLNHIPNEQTDVSLRWIETKKGGYISVPKPEHKFWKNFTRCSNKRFVVMPFGYTCKDSGHANYLLYDKKTKCLERFETFGKVNTKCLNPKNLDDKIKKLFQDNLGKDFIANYHKPLSYCPAKNFQTIQEDEDEMTKEDPVGFCSVWSAWYIDLRLSNPDIHRKHLVEHALKELKKLKKEKGVSFTTFIRNYSGFIVDVSNEIKKMYNNF